ncbi:MAG TPA: carbohydrate-binding domain-containing protein, partial [Symbiobacteriaceae bacterium]|nr:carbohydrate-binding domain-containing protein [Symbiobacteriaceae bacterium]
MNNKRSILPGLLLAATLAACSRPAPTATQTATTTAAKTTPTPVSIQTIAYESDDTATDWKNQNPTAIELKGDTATVAGTNAAVTGNKVMILSSGVYAISGKLTNGQIIVDVQNKGTVRLVLNGAEITSSDGPAIYVEKADKTIITLPDGTKNVVADGKSHAQVAGEEDQPDAAIYSKDDVTINGTGALTVHGNYKDGLVSRDKLVITGGNLAVTAVDDGVMGRDQVVVKEGTINIEAGGDGIKSSNDTDPAKGYIALEGGTFVIKSGNDGLQAESSLQVTGGTYTITTGGGSAKAAVKVSADGPMGGGPMGGRGQMPAAPAAPTTTATATDKPSAKALKAKTDITITGGTFTIDSADDAIHSNSTVTIAGGQIAISSGDDGIHADTSIAIKSGKIEIAKSYEGIESKLISYEGGETRLVSTDDGVNLAGGADGSSMGGRPGQNSFSAGGTPMLQISGGHLAVNALGDGIDVNGSLTMSGGTVVVSGPTAAMNGAVDYDGTFVMTGGMLVAAGSAGMAQAPSDTSSQYSIAMRFPSVHKAGTPVSLQDSQGKTLVTYVPPKEYQFVVFASPELKKGAAYTLYTGGTSTGTLMDGL